MRKLAWIYGVLLLILAVGGLLAGCTGISAPPRPPDRVKTMTVTGYCSCGQCCGWYRNWYFRPVEKATGSPKRVGQTASGVQAHYGTIAAPREIPFGTIMYVEGYGYGRVEDRGGLIKGNRLDLYFTSHTQARSWGSRKLNVKIWLPQKTGGTTATSRTAAPAAPTAGARLRK